ncbi:MAG TPA: hypothetical protein VFQ85_01620 [Mycobacteriales bacterium]|jgi:hypothetical protein|nr:hypothetical protein [Mycobacteriales bacterium]
MRPATRLLVPLLLLTTALPAHATSRITASPGGCSYDVSATSSTGGVTTFSGFLSGAVSPSTVGGTGTLRCWVQLTGSYDFTGAPAGNEPSPAYRYATRLAGAQSSLGMAVPPTHVSFSVAGDPDLYLCASVTDVNGVPSADWLWDASWVDPDRGTAMEKFVRWNDTPFATCTLSTSYA